MQKPTQLFKSECGKAQILVENDMPIGLFHDFLMLIKGLMVERMVQAHKEQVEQQEAMKQQEEQAAQPCEGQDCAAPQEANESV